jgi:hypothetical protein
MAGATLTYMGKLRVIFCICKKCVYCYKKGAACVSCEMAVTSDAGCAKCHQHG